MNTVRINNNTSLDLDIATGSIRITQGDHTVILNTDDLFEIAKEYMKAYFFY